MDWRRGVKGQALCPLDPQGYPEMDKGARAELVNWASLSLAVPVTRSEQLTVHGAEHEGVVHHRHRQEKQLEKEEQASNRANSTETIAEAPDSPSSVNFRFSVNLLLPWSCSKTKSTNSKASYHSSQRPQVGLQPLHSPEDQEIQQDNDTILQNTSVKNRDTIFSAP